MPKRLVAVAALVCALVGVSASAEAAALLRITSLDDQFPSSTTTSPVFIGGDGFRLTYISSGDGESADKSLVNPVFLILGVPDGGTAPTLAVQDKSAGITSVTVARGGANFYGGSWDPITGLVPQPFDGALPGNAEVYHDAVGFEYQGNGSQNYNNWVTYDPSPTTSWDIYVYTLTFTPDFGKSNWVDFVGTLATATYVVGYGCDELQTTGPAPAGRCASNGDVYSTPFTYAGLVTGPGRGGQQLVPEPASLLLFGTGLSVTAWASRRRRKKNESAGN